MEQWSCYWEPDFKTWSRGSHSPVQVRATADTEVAWFARPPFWAAPNAISNTALSTTEDSSTDKYFSPPPVLAKALGSVGQHRTSECPPNDLQVSLYKQYFLQATNIKTAQWTSHQVQQINSGLDVKCYNCISSVLQLLLHFREWDVRQLSELSMPD